MNLPNSGGGWPAILYVLRKSWEAGGLWKTWRAMRSRNACKTCALGMGGQLGGMVNETGSFPEVCKKSIQAMAADMQGRIQPHFFADFNLDKLRGFSSRDLEHAGRLAAPIMAGPLDQNYREIGWDEALDRIAVKLKATAPDESFFYFSGRSSNEAAFLLQLMARLYGTNNVNNCSYYCHQASGVALASITGSGTATVTLEDVEKTKLLFLIGGNPSSNHPRFMRTLVNLKRHGGRVVVVNPLREVGLVNFRVPSDPRSLLFGSKIADEYIQPHIGGDAALLTGIAKAVLAQGTADQAFIDAHTEGAAEWLASVEAADWTRIERDSGVDRATMERLARLYGSVQSAVFCWTMGITHHAHGVDNVKAIGNLALLRGMVGRSHSGLLPMRGHSNVQGVGSMGVTPKLKEAVFERLQSHFGIVLPTTRGFDTLECMEQAAAGRIRAAVCLGGNLFGSNPDATFAAQALARIDLVVYLSTTLNTGHAWGRGRETIVLPVLARDEEHEPTTQESMFNFVRMSDGGIKRFGEGDDGPRSETDITASLAQRILGNEGPIDWEELRHHTLIREAIGRIIPGYEAITEIDRTRREFEIGGRVFREPRFATPTGRARFHCVPLPDLHAAGPDALILMTIRSEGQFNTVVYEDDDYYRGQERRDVVLMAQADIDRLGLRIDARVLVRSEVGALH
ncbi:MAG: FdhF/YdeP family oxidoreductase, partial [Phycisphaerales bacterium]|nr:FdhF/YdeP family oxidoreductase [Phycisphaerales bacterium]